MALCLIVKDEEQIVGRCIESAAQIATKVFCIDTGSTDNTYKVVVETCDRLGLDCEISFSTWKSFGENRTELVQAAAGYADWLLLLDADMTISVEPEFQIPAEYDCFKLWYAGSLKYAQTLLVSGNHSWRYVGRTHEYITTDVPVKETVLHGILVRHHGDGSNRKKKFIRDIELLNQDLDDPAMASEYPRLLFYLAQSHEDLGDLQQAALFYERRARCGGWEEERWLAQLRHAKLLNDVEPLLRAYNDRPVRAEPLYYLARLCRQRGLYYPALAFAQLGTRIKRPDDILFVEDWIYAWGMLMEESISLWYCGQEESSRSLASWILSNHDLPQHVESTLKKNLEY